MLKNVLSPTHPKQLIPRIPTAVRFRYLRFPLLLSTDLISRERRSSVRPFVLYDQDRFPRGHFALATTINALPTIRPMTR